MSYLDFEKEEKGYKEFHLSGRTAKENIGKQIVFVLKRDVCKYRGYYNVRTGIIDSARYSQVFIDQGNDSIDVRDVLACGIKIENK